jgi:hypothetical protein
VALAARVVLCRVTCGVGDVKGIGVTNRLGKKAWEANRRNE